MRMIASLAAGLVFGIGLIVSGMTDPSKVLGFLDIAGLWDPSLALVMGGAIAVAVPAFLLARGRGKSLLGDPMRLPTASRVDRRLVVGGLAFGLGWGLAGFCPGPALASLAAGGAKPAIFTAAMAAGMMMFELFERAASVRASRIA
ncbi:DUF6691 family protein [Massilia cavernae]|uniref:YeeE/YedE family protein n=1 Tax=Massilia cavernae TaxID=2320864 RepID=A0A418Y135_9BURK|nr:DUF6691 family protein [Massilia cavernae]RJG19171.1 YeeE/YedE family protein [Massilia cavernae]